MLWGGRNTANRCHWPVWGVLSVWATLGLPRSRWHVLPGSTLFRLQGVLQRNCPEQALHSVPFPGLSRSCSQVLYKSTDSVGHAFCALPRSEKLRWLGTWWVHCPRWAACLNHLPGPGRSRVSLLWGADLRLRPSWQMSTIQDPRKMWLAAGSLLNLVEDASLWGPDCSSPLPSSSDCRPPGSLLRWGEGPVCSRSALLWCSLNPLFC